MLQHSPPDKALVEQAYSKLQQMLRQVSASQGQMLVEQGHKIQGLEKAVAAQEKVVADQGVKIDTMHSMLSDLHRAHKIQGLEKGVADQGVQIDTIHSMLSEIDA